jgi:hypothetical protein
LQEWCEGLAAIIWALRQQVKQLSDLKVQLSDPGNTPNLLPELLVGITDLLSNLVTGTFIIEKQPPQVAHIWQHCRGTVLVQFSRTLLRMLSRDPVLFYPQNPGSGFGMKFFQISDHGSQTCVADPDPGSGVFYPMDPGSGSGMNVFW